MGCGKVTKRTWIHLDIDPGLVIYICFHTTQWEKGKCVFLHRREIAVERKNRLKLKALIKGLLLCPYNRQVLLTFNGYSFFFER